MNRWAKSLLATFLFLTTGCASGRVNDLRDCVKVSAGVGVGFGVDVSLGVLSHPALGLYSKGWKVGFEDRVVAGMWSEQEMYSPITNIMANFKVNPAYWRRIETSSGIVPQQYSGGWYNVPANPDRPLFNRAADFGIGVSLLFVNARVGINPLECVDFLLGFAGIDIADDDDFLNLGYVYHKRLERIPSTVAVPKVEKPSPPTVEDIAKYANARATITTKYGKIVIKFFPDLAPMHVKNFITLAEAGFYNVTSFYKIYISPGLTLVGGDPSNTGNGGPGYSIDAEFTTKKSHVAGIVAMARDENPNSAGSQFKIMLADNPRLDGASSIFGEVVEGMDVARKIAAAPHDREYWLVERVDMSDVKITY